MSGSLSRTLAGILLALVGCALIAGYTKVNKLMRAKGSRAHWLVGWLLAASGMGLMGVGWALLCLSEPRLSLGWLHRLGLGLAVASGALYAVSARWVGRWRRLRSYSLGLRKEGIYARVRHPQALSLCMLAVALGLFSGAVPFLVTLPLWVGFWVLYTHVEERNELIPTFGEDYLEYARTTPRILPWRLRRE